MAFDEDGRRVAVLIDGDNFPAKLADRLFVHISALGNPIIRRVYGGSGAMTNWRARARSHGIDLREDMPGKNAADMHLTIEAMDILYGGKVEAFCIVSSDSDFSALARRLREDGVTVYGFGESKATDGFRRECDIFVVLSKPPPAKKAMEATIPKSPPAMNGARELFDRAIARLAPNNARVTLGVLGHQLKLLDKDFSTKRYGAKNLKTLVIKTGLKLKDGYVVSTGGQSAGQAKPSSVFAWLSSHEYLLDTTRFTEEEIEEYAFSRGYVESTDDEERVVSNSCCVHCGVSLRYALAPGYEGGLCDSCESQSD